MTRAEESRAKFTPGPWSRNIRAGGKYPVVFAGRNTYVAIAQQMPNPVETEANIELIAAAPSLYEALEQICATANAVRYKASDATQAVFEMERIALEALESATLPEHS